MKKYLPLVFVFFIAFFLRFYLLGQIPSGFHADESAFGYNAYSILKTGKDEYGQFLPLSFKSFGEYKPGLYVYLALPFIALFDLNPFSVRFASALFGTLTVILLYFLIKDFFKNSKLALFSSFLLAISPWHLNFSRTTSEVVVSLFFLLLSVYLLNFYLKGKSLTVLSFAFISVMLAVGSYTASRLFVVILAMLFFAFLVFLKKTKKFKPILLFLFLLISVSFLVNFIDSANRFKQINIFSHPYTQLILDEQFREDVNTSPLFTRAFHNKAINYSRTFFQNYGKYFTLDYLFLEGGNPKRMIIPSSGLFYVWQLPFLFLGLFFILKRKDKAGLFLIFSWFLLLIPAAFTFDEVPNVYRSLAVLFPMLIIIALGGNYFLKFKVRYKNIILVLILIFAFWEFGYYFHQYYKHQEVHQPWNRAYAYKPLFEELNKFYPKYKKIVITKSESSPYIHLLFYNKYDPLKYQASGSPRDKDFSGFDKYYFLPYDCPLSAGKEGADEVNGELGVLYVNRGSCVTPLHNTKVLGTIYWKDKSPAFKLLEYKE